LRRSRSFVFPGKLDEVFKCHYMVLKWIIIPIYVRCVWFDQNNNATYGIWCMYLSHSERCSMQCKWDTPGLTTKQSGKYGSPLSASTTYGFATAVMAEGKLLSPLCPPIGSPCSEGSERGAFCTALPLWSRQAPGPSILGQSNIPFKWTHQDESRLSCESKGRFPIYRVLHNNLLFSFPKIFMWSCLLWLSVTVSLSAVQRT
jgi:hypothetical protein